METIDKEKRVVNIKTPDGKFETIDVPPAAKRFDELKVGDKVSITRQALGDAFRWGPGISASG